MRENLPEISHKWVLTERFALISRLRAAASPEGEAFLRAQIVAVLLLFLCNSLTNPLRCATIQKEQITMARYCIVFHTDKKLKLRRRFLDEALFLCGLFLVVVALLAACGALNTSSCLLYTSDAADEL